MKKRIALLIGAGPAGLTAAYELLDKTDIKPVVFESTPDIGGISKTMIYKGNRMDIGGHRFFSRSDRINRWWKNILPLQGAPAADDIVLGRKVPLAKIAAIRTIGSSERRISPAPDPETDDRVMLHRLRFSRILYRKKFFNYPVSPTFDTLSKLGVIRVGAIGASYLHSLLFPIGTCGPSKTFSSTVSAKNSIPLFSRTTPKRSGESPAMHLGRIGGNSG